MRTVILPQGYGHMSLRDLVELAHQPEPRSFMDSYVPTSDEPTLDVEFEVPHERILLATELWYDVKKAWCRELQRALSTPLSP